LNTLRHSSARAAGRLTLLASSLLVSSTALLAQAPPGYYDTVDTSNGAALRSTLHEVIDDHLRFPYTSSATDTWDILEQADEDPNNASNVLDVYKNASYTKEGGGNSFYNREHTWPNSYGYPNDNSSNYPYTDCHALFLCDSSYNSSRSNKPYRNCDAACSEKATDFNNGTGGGTGFYPGNSNWTTGSFTAGTWEVWGDRRGDIARAQLYLDVRYEGGMHNVTSVLEPDLILTDNEALIAASNTGSNESVAHMGMLSVLLQWHAEDPVDALEQWRNDRIFDNQGNRNPFIDHPEWVDCLFNGTCGDVTPPAAPSGLSAFAGLGYVDVDWSDNGEGDLSGYNVFRSETNGGPYTQLNVSQLGSSFYSDTAVTGGTTYYYVATAVDTSGNESGFSFEVFGTPTGSPPSGDPWINELHYDNSGSDTGEFVEVAGPAGLDLSGWQLVGYNGNGGGTYKTVNLSGTLPDQGGCLGTLSFAFSSMQNGAPDGMALVDGTGTVIEFLSYEGQFTATNGPASSMTSVDIGVTETSSTPVGFSLQLGGTGSGPADFFWQTAQADTPGLVNAGQTLTGGCGGGGPTPPTPPAGLSALAGDGEVDLTWSANPEPDVAGYNVLRSTTSGSGYTQQNGALVTGTFFGDSGLANGTTYFYVVTAVNTSSQESPPSSEASATPTDGTPPAAATGLTALSGDGVVDLDWNDNGEGDLAGYNVHRSLTAGGSYTQLNGSALLASAYSDTSVSNGTTYYYVVTAVDTASNESSNSSEVVGVPAGAGGPVVLAYDNFESGWGNYTDGGSDCRRYTGGSRAWEGIAAANIQDNSGTSSSFTLTNGIDVHGPGYTQLEVNFHFYANSMESNEDFWLQYFDGSGWITVATWARGVDFQNNQFQEETVLINEGAFNFPTDMKLRFRCDASGNRDDVYIDAITISAQ
jgi:endonuclease I/fibronectin type 3 domain-containing protein